jgi:hypothetical protein
MCQFIGLRSMLMHLFLCSVNVSVYILCQCKFNAVLVYLFLCRVNVSIYILCVQVSVYML